jgi:hypothetical protein
LSEERRITNRGRGQRRAGRIFGGLRATSMVIQKWERWRTKTL